MQERYCRRARRVDSTVYIQDTSAKSFANHQICDAIHQEPNFRGSDLVSMSSGVDSNTSRRILIRENSRKVLYRICAGLALVVSLYAFQRPFRVYPSMEAYDNIPLPLDYQESDDWIFARLMY